MEYLLSNLDAILVSSISMSIPLILAAIGGVFSVRSGIMALGLESMMMVGSFTAVLGSFYSGNVYIGFLTGILGGVIFSAIYGVLSIRYKVNQVISGIGLNLLALATTTLLMQLIWGNRGNSPQVASLGNLSDSFLAKIPVVGDMLGQLSGLAYVTVAIAIVGWVILFKTTYGLRLRMVGENPKAASSMGLKVRALKYSGVMICGGLAGLGGAYLSLDHLDMFVRDMTSGRGYIAVVIAILARYNPLGVVICGLLFGFCDAVQIYLQGQGVPTQLIQMIPYIATLVVLTFAVKHIKAPAGVQKHEDE